MRARTRLALVVGATVFLTLAGSSAYAVWSSGATVSSTAKAATIGITQTVPATPDLTHTYSATSLVAATPVTLANTGNRDATYTLKLLATSTTAGLPGAVAVKIAAVTATTDCTRTATLTSPTTGALSATTSLAATGTFVAGGSVILCVQTSMTAANALTYAEKTMTVAITGTTTLGTSGLAAWTTSTAATTVTQDVASAQLYTTDKSGRYTIYNANLCIESYETSKLIRTTSGSCSGTQGQWRLAKDATTGHYYISQSTNGTSTGLGWNAASPLVSEVSTATTASQRWAVELRADGKYRFHNDSTGTCAYVSATGADGGTNLPILQLATCDDANAAQGFTLTLVGSPIPTTPNATTCTGNGTNFIQIGWPGATGYEQEVRWKFYVNNIYVKDVTDGYNPYVQLSAPGDLPTATYGTGVLPVRAEQSISGSGYTIVATGSMYIQPGTGYYKCAP